MHVQFIRNEVVSNSVKFHILKASKAKSQNSTFCLTQFIM
jgi:hypothetical protein